MAKATVCKTVIPRFKSGCRLQLNPHRHFTEAPSEAPYCRDLRFLLLAFHCEIARKAKEAGTYAGIYFKEAGSGDFRAAHSPQDGDLPEGRAVPATLASLGRPEAVPTWRGVPREPERRGGDGAPCTRAGSHPAATGPIGGTNLRCGPAPAEGTIASSAGGSESTPEPVAPHPQA